MPSQSMHQPGFGLLFGLFFCLVFECLSAFVILPHLTIFCWLLAIVPSHTGYLWCNIKALHLWCLISTFRVHSTLVSWFGNDFFSSSKTFMSEKTDFESFVDLAGLPPFQSAFLILSNPHRVRTRRTSHMAVRFVGAYSRL